MAVARQLLLDSPINIARLLKRYLEIFTAEIIGNINLYYVKKFMIKHPCENQVVRPFLGVTSYYE